VIRVWSLSPGSPPSSRPAHSLGQINSQPPLKTPSAWVTLRLTLETDLMFCYLASHIHFTGATLVMDGSASRTLNGKRAAASNGYLAGRTER
jgi:hypothetical protein